MSRPRFSAGQKEALLQLHFNELKVGDGSTLPTSNLREVVANILDRNLNPNHFSASLHKLVAREYLTVEYNVDRKLHPSARVNEGVWALTILGRQYAETLYSARVRPIRRYSKTIN